MNKLLNILIDVSLEAGMAIMDIYNTNFDVEYKEDNSPLTIADLKANEIIVNRLKKEYPSYGILSEESKDDKSRLDLEYVFIIDPIDGTKEFVKKNGEFTVNIGLVKNHKVILGVIYAPAKDLLYYGGIDIPATKCITKDYKIISKEDIHVSNKTKDLILLGSKSHKTDKLDTFINNNKDIIKEFKQIGSSLKGCLVAQGYADIYYKYGINSEWDTCAMQAIVEAAGGVFRQMDNTEMIYNRPNTKNLKGTIIVNREENIFIQ